MAAADDAPPHSLLPSHLFPSFAAAHADNHAQQPRRTGRRLSKVAKLRAHRLRTRLHEWEEQLEEKAPAPLKSVGVGLPRAMPDMRFEQSYLATIRAFVHELTPSESAEEKRAVKAEQRRGSVVSEKGHPQHRVVATLHRTPEPELWLGNLKVDWYPLLWVTFRDQIVSPLVQGTVWGLAGLVFAQTRALLLANRRVGRR